MRHWALSNEVGFGCPPSAEVKNYREYSRNASNSQIDSRNAHRLFNRSTSTWINCWISQMHLHSIISGFCNLQEEGPSQLHTSSAPFPGSKCSKTASYFDIQLHHRPSFFSSFAIDLFLFPQTFRPSSLLLLLVVRVLAPSSDARSP